MMGFDEDDAQPTMEDILDFAFDNSISRALDEIILAAESMRISMAQHSPALRDYDTLQKHAHTIDFYSRSLTENLEKSRNG